LCPDTPSGEDVNSVGCSDSQLEAANDGDSNDENNDDEVSESTEGFLGMEPLTLGGIGGGILVLVIISLLYVKRGGGDSDIDWKYEEEDMLFETQASSMSEGYEVTEYPDGSGAWWWKDPATGNWDKWT
jgi:hypothetical protein